MQQRSGQELVLGHNSHRERGELSDSPISFGLDAEVLRPRQTTVQEITLEFDKFAPSVRDIRMLRIEDDNDLRPAIEPAMQLKSRPAQPVRK